jgi:hypothetical protein
MLRWLKIALVNVAVLFGLFIFVEGGISLFLVFRDVTVLAWEAAPYTEYDADLGWVAKQRVVIPNFWGKGIGVRTNSQRFRASEDVLPAVAAGKTRVICSGDSFTFGDGVDNPETWCQQLASRDSRIQPVNLGQGGYGTDQAYLRFLRDTRNLSHQAHLFAFIDDDFRRMQSARFLGFNKPVLTLDRGMISVGNVPVPKTATTYPWLIALPRALMETRMAVFATRVLKKYGPEAPPTAEKDAETQAVLRAMFAELKRVNQQRGSTLFLVHLPTAGELGGIDPWSPFLDQAAQDEQIPMIDLVSAFRGRTDAKSFFLSQGTAGGHYNAAGHAFVADVVHERIRYLLSR